MLSYTELKYVRRVSGIDRSLMFIKYEVAGNAFRVSLIAVVILGMLVVGAAGNRHRLPDFRCWHIHHRDGSRDFVHDKHLLFHCSIL